MRTIRASAPTKAIIAGEHSVVYGGSGIAVPLNNRKECTCDVSKAEPGKGEIIVDDAAGIGKYYSDGNFADLDGWFLAKVKLVEYILGSEGKSINGMKMKLVFSKNKIPKGTGHSAATAAAMALCLYEALGIAAGREKLFEAIQVFEEQAHGGKPSGIDAMTVISGRPQKFRKRFLEEGKMRYEFEDLELMLPRGTALLIADTLREGEIADTTAGMIGMFSKNRGILKNPAELSEGERLEITAPFDGMVEKILREMHGKGSAEKLGKLMNENHEMLKEAGVSSEGIEKAVEISLKNGALGGKITGAGGIGGAVLVLAKEKDAERILGALKNEGMGAVKAEISTRGAMLEK